MKLKLSFKNKNYIFKILANAQTAVIIKQKNEMCLQ